MFLLFSIIEENSEQAEIHLPLEGSTVPANVIRKILLIETVLSQYRHGFHNLTNNMIESYSKVLKPISIIFFIIILPAACRFNCPTVICRACTSFWQTAMHALSFMWWGGKCFTGNVKSSYGTERYSLTALYVIRVLINLSKYLIKQFLFPEPLLKSNGELQMKCLQD